MLEAEALAAALPMVAAIGALEATYGADRLPEAPLRGHHETTAGALYTMPAFGDLGVGVKLVTVTPGNPDRGLPFIHGAYVLFDAETQAPRAVIDGGALTAIRTAAVSGLATRHLAREDASRLAIFGAGVQARSHLAAMRAVRPVAEVMIVSRTRERAAALAEEAAAVGLDARVGSAEEVTGYDLVCTCTSSATPVLEGARLAPGTHVNSVGAHTTAMRELDGEAVRRARVVVETREVAAAEAGDLALAIAEGAIGPDHVAADLAEVVRGARIRRSEDDITLFKSVGVAFEDLAVARAAVDRLGM